MTIIETSSNQFYFVAEYDDANLAHVWRGLRVKRVAIGWEVIGKREEMVRKAGCRAVPIDISLMRTMPAIASLKLAVGVV